MSKFYTKKVTMEDINKALNKEQKEFMKAFSNFLGDFI